MWKAIAIFCLALAITVAKEENECATKNDVQKADWDALNADPLKPADKMLCYFKCIYEKNEILKEDGTIDVEKLIESTTKWKPLTDASKTSIRECARGSAPVKSCPDVKPSFKCVQEAVEKQKQEAA